MKNLQVFNNQEFGQVRVINKSGEPWFVAKDVCDILEIRNSRDAMDRLSESMKGVATTDTLGGRQKMNTVSEAGLYKLVFTSRKPEAERFTDWIATDVIPSIRKHGMYATDELINNPDLLIGVATALKEERAKRIEMERFNKQIASSENSLLVREVAKIASKDNITIGEKRLWNKLRDWGLIFKNSTEPMQEYVDRGYFEVVEGVRETSTGVFTYKTTRVTGKGQVYIIKRLIKEKTAS